MREVICTTCDPPSIRLVPEDWEISEPYVCTVCIQRALKRMLRATNPMFGRVGHGASEVSKGEKS